jgi:hypothetical protein
MGQYVYTQEQKDFIRKHYPKKGAEWVAKKLNIRKAYIKSFASNNKIHRTNFNVSDANRKFIRENANRLSFDEIAIQTGEKVSRIKTFVYREKLRPCLGIPFSEEHEQFIRDNYHDLSNTEIAAIIGRNNGDSIKGKMKQMGLSRSKKELLAINARLCSDTWIKPGNEPKNTKFDGYTSTRIDSHGNPYQYIRISKGHFKQLHYHNWEKVNGPVPEGMILRSKDGDSSNCEPENWELIDRAEHLAKNSGREELTDQYILSKLTHRAPELKPAFREMPELIELKRSQIKLKRTINELTETPTNG